MEWLPSSGQIERDKQEEEAAVVAATLNKKCFAKPEEVIQCHHTMQVAFKKINLAAFAGADPRK